MSDSELKGLLVARVIAGCDNCQIPVLFFFENGEHLIINPKGTRPEKYINTFGKFKEIRKAPRTIDKYVLAKDAYGYVFLN